MNIMKKNVIVFDLDNCLASDGERMHLIRGGANAKGELPCNYEKATGCAMATQALWNDYHAAAAKATPHHIDFFHDAANSLPKGSWIVFLTARPECFAAQTSKWLHEHGFASVPQWTLLMRKNGCLAPSPVMKPQVLRDWLEANGMSLSNVAALYDDRDDVLEAFEALGVPSHQLAIEVR